MNRCPAGNPARGHLSSPTPQKAFALADLLVVLAVLALGASVATPMLVRTRERTQIATCTTNLRQVNRAVLQYANDHAQRFPAAITNQQLGVWWWYKEMVKGYAGLTGKSSIQDKVFACPKDRGYSDPGPFHRNAKFDFSSYVFNGVTLPGVPNLAGWELSAVRQPQRTLLTMEWCAHAPLSWHRSRTGIRNHPFYNNAESLVGFVDGHVALIPIYYDGINPAYTRDPIPGYDYQYSGE